MVSRCGHAFSWTRANPTTLGSSTPRQGRLKRTSDCHRSQLPPSLLARCVPCKQRVTAGDIAVLLGLSDLGPRDSSDRQTAASGQRVEQTEREWRQSQIRSAPSMEQESQHGGSPEKRGHERGEFGRDIGRASSGSTGRNPEKKSTSAADGGPYPRDQHDEHEGRIVEEGKRPRLGGGPKRPACDTLSGSRRSGAPEGINDATQLLAPYVHRIPVVSCIQ